VGSSLYTSDPDENLPEERDGITLAVTGSVCGYMGFK